MVLGESGGRKKLEWNHLYWACHVNKLSAVNAYKCRAGAVSLMFIYFINILFLLTV